MSLITYQEIFSEDMIPM